MVDSLHVTGASFSEDALDLAQRLSDAATALHLAEGVSATARTAVELARTLVPGAGCAGVSEIAKGEGVRTLAHTDDVVPLMDTLARTSPVEDEGAVRPAWRVLWDEDVPLLVVPDVAAGREYGADGARVAALGIRSALVCRLRATNRRLTVLALYSAEPCAFDATAARMVRMLGVHVGVALESAVVQEQLTEAMRTRDVIGQATGILMGKLDIDGTEAFRRLVRASQKENVKVRHIARRIVESAGGG
ncbi:GAF and ANTAR domain-containing protein [Streptomyces sp. NPDC059740]|uniref:GAF and ANTAR domain-containing protein n=1 Tax=Streptomyces sp. NPDC059740 TaxID=3346926 RepID=UPI00364AA93B